MKIVKKYLCTGKESLSLGTIHREMYKNNSVHRNRMQVVSKTSRQIDNLPEVKDNKVYITWEYLSPVNKPEEECIKRLFKKFKNISILKRIEEIN